LYTCKERTNGKGGYRPSLYLATFVLDDLSKQYETGRGFTGERKEDGTFKPKEDKLSFSGRPEKNQLHDDRGLDKPDLRENFPQGNDKEKEPI